MARVGRTPSLIVAVGADPALCRALAHALGPAYRLQALQGVQPAQEALAGAGPRLLLLSLEADEAEGLRFLAAFREGSLAPVLLLARQVSEAVAIRAIDLRVDGCLKLPVSIVTLCSRIEALLAEGPSPELLAERARQLIDGQDDLSLSGAEVAGRLGVAEKHLRRIFQLRFGRTPAQYIRAARLRRAQRLLTTTDLRIAAVAAQAGFRDATYLGVVFKREVGMTPLAFRRIHWGPAGRRDENPPTAHPASDPGTPPPVRG